MVKDWKKIKEEKYNAGYRRMIRRTFELPNGKIDDFDLNYTEACVCVVPITADNKIVLAKQFRPGPEKILLELPGGGLNEKETPIEAIKRQLLEETGYTGDFQFAGTTRFCAYSTLLKYNFVATNCKKVQEQKLDDNEFIDVVKISLNEFRKHLQSGELTDVEVGYLGLDFLNLL